MTNEELNRIAQEAMTFRLLRRDARQEEVNFFNALKEADRNILALVDEVRHLQALLDTCAEMVMAVTHDRQV